MTGANINLGILIDSKISSAFGSSINTANEKLNSLGSSVENLNNKKVNVNIDEMTSKLNIVSANLKKLQNEKMHLEIELETADLDTNTEKISKRISELDSKIAKLSSYKTILDFDLKDSIKDIQETTKELTKLEKIVQSTNKHKLNIEAQAQKRDELKKGIVDKIALGASLAVPIKMSMSFESAMADVNKVVDFESKEELKLFEKDILALTRTIPLSANAIAEITASGGQLGIAKNDLIQFTTVVSKMSTAFNLSPKDAGDSIAEIMRVYKLGINEAQLLGDAVNHLSDNIGVEASKIIETTKLIGGNAQIFGINEVQASALATAFISLGKAPSVAANSINTLFNNLSNAEGQGKDFKEALSSIGYSASELKEKIGKDANGTLQEFLTALSKVDKSEQMGILTNLFGRNYADDMALLIGSLGQYEKALELTANKQNYLGSTQREFEIRSKTTENNIQRLSNGISEIAINFGNIFLPPLNLAVSALRFFTTTIVDLMNISPIIGGLIKTVAGLFGAFITVSVGGTALAYVMTFVSSGFSRLALLGNLLKLVYTGLATKKTLLTAKTFLYATAQKVATASSFVFGGALKLLGGAIGFVSSAFLWLGKALLMNPIGLAITAIAGVALLIYTYWEPVKGFFLNLWDKVKSIFSNNWEFIKQILSFNPFSIIYNAWVGVFDWFSSKFDFISTGIEKLKSLGSTVSGWFSSDSKNEVALNSNTLALANVGDGYTQSLDKSVNSQTYKSSNTNYTNNTSKNSNDTSSIVINVNNPVVKDDNQKQILEQDIKKMVNIAMKEKEQSYKNRTLKDIE